MPPNVYLTITYCLWYNSNMKLNKCIICGGPRRSLTQEVCSRCRPKHIYDFCPRCGKRKLAEASICIRCHAKEIRQIRWSKPHSQKTRTDICPECGGVKYKVSPRCQKCNGKRAMAIQLMRKPPKPEIIDRKGYVWIYTPNREKPRTKRSRLIMEQNLGRPLFSTEDVHHLNGIRDDDRLENLVIILHKEHSHLHNPKGKPTPVSKEKLREAGRKGAIARWGSL